MKPLARTPTAIPGRFDVRLALEFLARSPRAADVRAAECVRPAPAGRLGSPMGPIHGVRLTPTGRQRQVRDS
jgi:hypothetical protein